MNNNNIIEICKEYAESKGGQFLSTEYINNHTKMLWKCSNPNHQPWETSYAKAVQKGTWCPRCVGRFSKEEKLLMAKQYAESKGGKCLSNEFNNVKNKLLWKCTKGHEWKASYDNVKRGTWCPQCSIISTKEKQKNKDGLSLAQKYAESKGGKCLSTEYINAYSKLIWKCDNPNHQPWDGSYTGVFNRSWCPECVGRFSKQKGLLKSKEYAESKGGKCLSTEYINNHTKMLWQCSNKDHDPWESDYNHTVGRGSWCPQCSYYHYKEHKVRDLLEYLLEVKFKKSKPIWNINPKTNKPLELDGYNSDLQIAFEFQGDHHYNEKAFRSNEQKLNYIKYKDSIKKQNCLNQKVKLLIIDDKFPLKKDKEIYDYVLDLLKSNNINFRTEINEDEISDIFNKVINHQENYLLKAKEFAKIKRGECLSTKYFYAKEKLIWKCDNPNHPTWEATYDSIMRGSWCFKCGIEKSSKNKKKKNALVMAKKYAEDKGGQCLSNEYINCNEKMQWKCNNSNHEIWSASYTSVVDNHTWCSYCSHRKLTKIEAIAKAKKHAEDKSGKLLSTDYLNTHSKMHWGCNQGHKWIAKFTKVINENTWCPKCSIEKRKKSNSSL